MKRVRQALTKQVMIKSIIEGVRPEAYRSFNVDEGKNDYSIMGCASI